jgi:hypothetical protein
MPKDNTQNTDSQEQEQNQPENLSTSDSDSPSGNTEPDNETEGVSTETQEDGKDVDWKKRYSDSSREAKKLAEERKQMQKELEQARQGSKQALTFAMQSRGRFEEYLDHIHASPARKQELLQQYDQNYQGNDQAGNQAGSTGSDNTQQPQPNQNQVNRTPPVDPLEQMDPTTRAALQEQRAQYAEKVDKRRRAWDSFMQKEGNNLSPDMQQALAMSSLAIEKEEQVEPQQAIAEAKRRLLNASEIREEGYAEGMRDGITPGVNRGVGSKSNTKSEQSAQLPPKHERYLRWEMDRKGIEPNSDEARKMRANYAERLQGR